MKKSMKRLDKQLAHEASFFYMDAPHVLPSDNTMDVDGFVVLVEDSGDEEEREERAWFFYDEKDPAEVPLDFITKAITPREPPHCFADQSQSPWFM